ncbi:MAG: DUF3857 domain-containing protein [Bacteroidia bacterium]|nr:DUF3857 domain-containing protein [Bacteroidia bacterium]
MKKLSLAITFFLLMINMVKSQNFTHDFGKYNFEELQMNSYSKDVNAEAVVIYDIGKSYFFVNRYYRLELMFEKKIKIKIFSKAGIKWAQFEIPFYEKDNSSEQVLTIEGNTYNYENGQIRCTPLNVKNIFNEKVDKNWSNKKFAMPDVKEGSVIEVKYTISSPFFFNFRGWEFQTKIPVIYSEYITKMIPLYTYQYILQGTSKLSEFKQFIDPGLETRFGGLTWKDMDYVFIMKDVPAFNDETFVTSSDDYIIKLDFQLSEYMDLSGVKTEVMSTWPKLVKDILDEDTFGGYIKSCQNQAKNIIDTMDLVSMSPQEKAEKIFRFVKYNYNWNGRSSKFSSQKTKEFLKTKVGNSADINLFLLGILKVAGLEVSPLIISTRSNGKIKYDYPFQHFFNYVIVVLTIDNKHITLDATEPLCSFGMIPPRCLNDKGLFMKKAKDVEWFELSSSLTSNTEYEIDLQPKIEADSITATIKILTSGYDALNLRKRYYKSSSDLKEEIIMSNQTLIDSIKVVQLTQIEKPFITSFKANTSIDIVDDKLIISPFYGFSISDNPLKQIVRLYPIDMTYRKQRKFTASISVPEGYKVLTTPEALEIDNDIVRISYSFINESDKLVKLIGLYEFKKDVYPSTSYQVLKFYFKKIIDKFNEKVILVKE